MLRSAVTMVGIATLEVINLFFLSVPSDAIFVLTNRAELASAVALPRTY